MICILCYFPLFQTDLQWHHTYTITPGDSVYACHWVKPQHLAICMKGCVKVYEVTTTSSRLVYTITSQEWEGKIIHGVAVSESLPGSMLVICQFQPHVYQFSCHEATQQVKKFRIKSDEDMPWCIVANASVAAIKLSGQSSFIVCSLPDFTHQSHVQTSFRPDDRACM